MTFIMLALILLMPCITYPSQENNQTSQLSLTPGAVPKTQQEIIDLMKAGKVPDALKQMSEVPSSREQLKLLEEAATKGLADIVQECCNTNQFDQKTLNPVLLNTLRTAETISDKSIDNYCRVTTCLINAGADPCKEVLLELALLQPQLLDIITRKYQEKNKQKELNAAFNEIFKNAYKYGKAEKMTVLFNRGISFPDDEIMQFGPAISIDPSWRLMGWGDSFFEYILPYLSDEKKVTPELFKKYWDDIMLYAISEGKKNWVEKLLQHKNGKLTHEHLEKAVELPRSGSNKKAIVKLLLDAGGPVNEGSTKLLDNYRLKYDESPDAQEIKKLLKQHGAVSDWTFWGKHGVGGVLLPVAGIVIIPTVIMIICVALADNKKLSDETELPTHKIPNVPRKTTCALTTQ